ncbi:MAG: MtnX-like HAD-IB family phosphatase [Vampirovibrionia bacterium]
MSNKNQRIVLVSDFDGTISKEDFFMSVVNNLLDESDMQPWHDFYDKKISHFEALSRIYSKIRLSREDLDKFILEIPIEEKFLETVEYCTKHGIGIYILSAGADYYINLILKNLGIKDLVNVYTNKSYYVQQEGLKIIDPKPTDPFYSYKYGIDKKSIIQFIKAQYDYCIFAGDGRFDFPPAMVADVIFAKDRLLKLCDELEVKTNKFESYSEILDYIKTVNENQLCSQ